MALVAAIFVAAVASLAGVSGTFLCFRRLEHKRCSRYKREKRQFERFKGSKTAACGGERFGFLFSLSLQFAAAFFFSLSHFQHRLPSGSSPHPLKLQEARVLSQELTTTTSTSPLATSSFMGLLNPGAAGKGSSGGSSLTSPTPDGRGGGGSGSGLAAPAAVAISPAAVEKTTTTAAAAPVAPAAAVAVPEDSLTKAFASLPGTTTTTTTKASASASAASASSPAASTPQQQFFSPENQPLCPGTPSAIYSCIPPGFSPSAAPDLKACVNLCSAPAPTLLQTSDSDSSSNSLCLNCVDPATACRKAHGEFGSGAFTFALTSKQATPCAAPAVRAKPGEEKCAPNQGANNVGCGNKGDNNRG